jgi:hypothetical protein
MNQVYERDKREYESLSAVKTFIEQVYNTVAMSQENVDYHILSLDMKNQDSTLYYMIKYYYLL